LRPGPADCLDFPAGSVTIQTNVEIRENAMSALNELQRQSLLTCLLDLHHRLTEMEATIAQGLLDSPFARHVNDLSPTESKVLLDYFGRIRQAMRTCVREGGIPLDFRRKSVRWVLQCGLLFLESAVAEITVDKLAGYGDVSAEGREQAERMQSELRRLIQSAANYLRQGIGRDLAQSLVHLDAAGAVVGQLGLLDRLLTRWGLVEFRPTLDRIVRRLEEPRFEIAVFGRVNSGKSSLLNHVAGFDVLPVGVVPITAVPTRLLRGERAEAIISCVQQQARTVAVEELRAYASEEGNPGNRKHVVAIEVHVPSPRLRQGVVLVDTPGIGSLATTGSAETFAYLPQCDLGIVLIDAGSTINADDLNLLRLLTEAGVPVQVLLSKADLLSVAQQQQVAEYIRTQIQQQVGPDVAVHPISIVGEAEALLNHWFEREIEPMMARSRALVEESLGRKIAHLRASVTAVLSTLQQRARGKGMDHRSTATAALWLMDDADEAIRHARVSCRDWTRELPQLCESIIGEAAKAVVHPPPRPSPTRGEGESKQSPIRGEGEKDSLPPCGGGLGWGGQTCEVDPVTAVVRGALTQRGQAARTLVAELQTRLADTLVSLQPLLPMAGVEEATVREFVCRGLPPVDMDLPKEWAKRVRPWWSVLLPRAAQWSARRELRNELGPFLGGPVAVYDRQVQAWLRNSLTQLIGLYEAQAEVLREQARRMKDTLGDELPNEQALEADLRALRDGADSEEALTAITDAQALPS
jgi:GTP-binding protein EngB required for normal cell division